VPVSPMFPLESVLVPGMVLPLHVFEPRYRALVRDCLAGDRSFGVVLIERGSEVGGGDARSDIGTRAEIVRADELSDGRWAVVAVGTSRVRVDRWLPDDPYPRAELVDWPEASPEPGSPAHDALVARYGEQVLLLRRVLAMAAELGHPTDATAEVAEDPISGSYHLAVLAPVGPLDRQRLLAADGPAERLEQLSILLQEQEMVLGARLAGG
jgi:uncharacterized protein